MALYLIIDIKRLLRFALSCSSKKHKVKPKKRVEDLVRIALPGDFFDKRQIANAQKEKREEAAVRHHLLRDMETQANLHISSIRNESN